MFLLAYIICVRKGYFSTKDCPPIQVAAQLTALNVVVHVHHTQHVPLQCREEDKVNAATYNNHKTTTIPKFEFFKYRVALKVGSKNIALIHTTIQPTLSDSQTSVTLLHVLYYTSNRTDLICT